MVVDPYNVNKGGTITHTNYKDFIMSDPTNVFKNTNEESNNQETPEQNNEPQSGDLFSNQLKEIKAEDGRQKYDTVEKALEALTHSQTLIPTLQSQVTALELDKTNLREELAKSKGAQELIDSLTNHQQGEQQGNPSESQFGEADVARMLEATLDKREQVKVVNANASKVQDALVGAFGAKANEVVQAKAKELNMTPEALGKLAESAPDMVLALFNNKSASPSVTNTSVHLGFNTPEVKPLVRPESSLLSGATAKEQTEFMLKVKEDVYKRLNVTE